MAVEEPEDPMHVEETTLECIVCAAALPATEPRAYRLEDNDCLCYRCAVERGGVYDADSARWTVAPNALGD
jgi:hypothetical protein